MTGGFQQLHVQGGLTAKLDALRALHEEGHESAWRLALERKRFFEKRAPMYYLDALAVCAWLERTCHGGYSAQTEDELRVFDKWGAIGKKALLQAQGFLS
jgi:hypothetical protein